jgi:hypothetical protein
MVGMSVSARVKGAIVVVMMAAGAGSPAGAQEAFEVEAGF